MSDQALIEVQHLKKYFKTPHGLLHAVDDVSFEVKAGTTLGVVGESGCGKSTMGRSMIRLHEPTSGSVHFNGQDVLKLNKKEMKNMRAQMQMIFQDPFASLNPRMTVMEQIAEPLIVQEKKRIKDKEVVEEVRRLMDLVGLAPRLINAYPHELDGGRRQRIGIAKALSVHPKFIVCDEPVSALDVSIQAQILNLLTDLQKQLDLTYLFITHDLSVVKYISDEIIVMYLGQVVEKAHAHELFEQPMHPYTKALLSAIPIPDPHRKMNRVQIEGEVTSPIDPPPGCRFCSRCPYADAKCKAGNIELKEVNHDHFVACVKC